MNEEKIATLEAKVDAIFISVEKTRKYFQWLLILTTVFFFLPLIGVASALPMLLNALSLYQNLGL